MRMLPILIYLATFAFCAENEVVLNLEPNKQNPRNSEGAFITLNDGRVLFLYTQFYGGGADESPARIAGVISSDKGATWSAPKIAFENDGRQNIMSVSLMRLPSGKILLLYLVKNSLSDCRPVCRISGDEALTWSEPKYLTETPEYFVVNNDRVVRLKSERLVVPAAWHDCKGGRFNAHAVDRFFYSDDDGKSWRESHARVDVPAKIRAGLQEPGLIELSDGALFGFARTDAGAQFGFVSKDAGLTFSEPQPTELKSPLSPASIKRFNDSTLLAVFNDHSGQFEFPKGKRTPLASALSTDEGKTWAKRKLIESDKDGWYCYTAIHFVDDFVLLGYCAGDPKVGGLNRLRIRRIKRAWFEQ